MTRLTLDQLVAEQKVAERAGSMSILANQVRSIEAIIETERARLAMIEARALEVLTDIRALAEQDVITNGQAWAFHTRTHNIVPQDRSQLIVDGSISPNKIAAGTITATLRQ